MSICRMIDDDCKKPEIRLPNTEQGICDTASDDKVLTLQDIFNNRPTQEIEQAVRMSAGNINLAAQQLVGNDQGKASQTVLKYCMVH